MKTIAMNLILTLALTLTTSSAQAKPPFDSCQTQGPVTICSAYALGDTYNVFYQGYLYNSGVLAAGSVNGQAITPLEMARPNPTAQGVSAGIKGAGRSVTEIELYFFDRAGRFDSQFGENYHFEFRY